MKNIARDLQCTSSFAVVTDVTILIVYRRLSFVYSTEQSHLLLIKKWICLGPNAIFTSV